MWLIKYKSIFFVLSAILIAGSLFAIGTYGLNFGIDFTGGSLVEVEYASTRPEISDIKYRVESISSINFGEVAVQPAGERGAILRLRTITDDEKQVMVAAIAGATNTTGVLTEKNFTSIGPSLGRELANRGLIALALSLLCILIYIAIVFRPSVKQSGRGPAAWKFSLAVVTKVAHDLIILVGVFAWLGYYLGTEVDALFLAAFLTVLGLSVNDVIAVFDRIRENVRRQANASFDEIVGRSLSETMGRSINTSLTVIFVLLAIYFLGGVVTRDFALALSAGMIVATYSSIFIASPLLVVWEKWGSK